MLQRLLKVLLWAAIVIVTLAAVLSFTGVVSAYRAPTESMRPELSPGDRFVVLKAGYEPKVGDVVVTRAPSGFENGACGAEPPTGEMCAQPPAGGLGDVKLVKRVVGGPGDRLRMEDGRVFRNGRPETGYRTRPCDEDVLPCDFPQEIRVPDGHWFLLGDNRGRSQDSRFWGPVPTDAIEGRKLLTYWQG